VDVCIFICIVIIKLYNHKVGLHLDFTKIKTTAFKSVCLPSRKDNMKGGHLQTDRHTKPVTLPGPLMWSLFVVRQGSSGEPILRRCRVWYKPRHQRLRVPITQALPHPQRWRRTVLRQHEFQASSSISEDSRLLNRDSDSW